MRNGIVSHYCHVCKKDQEFVPVLDNPFANDLEACLSCGTVKGKNEYLTALHRKALGEKEK